MTIFTLGSTNTAALSVPGAYVAIVPPQITYINGVPTGVLGVVGSAAWGPVGAPTTVGTYGEYVANFGTLQARRYDMGTAVAVAVQQGCNNMVCVRVTRWDRCRRVLRAGLCLAELWGTADQPLHRIVWQFDRAS